MIILERQGLNRLFSQGESLDVLISIETESADRHCFFFVRVYQVFTCHKSVLPGQNDGTKLAITCTYVNIQDVANK